MARELQPQGMKLMEAPAYERFLDTKPGEITPANVVYPEELLIPGNRGFCAGVDRAIQMLWVIHQEARKLDPEAITVCVNAIVHNDIVNSSFKAYGVLVIPYFDEEFLKSRLPHGYDKRVNVVFSAHGSPPQELESARNSSLVGEVHDAACQLVIRVQNEAEHYEKQGYHIAYIGQEGHRESLGVMSRVPGNISLIRVKDGLDPREDIEDLIIRAGSKKVVCLTQTTLAKRQTERNKDLLRELVPGIKVIDDVCYATTFRQLAVERGIIDHQAQAVLAVGSKTSSNTGKLAAVAMELGVPAQRIDAPEDIDLRVIHGTSKILVTLGASGPEDQLKNVIDWFKKQTQDRIKITLLGEVRAESDKTLPMPNNLAQLWIQYQSSGNVPIFKVA